MTDMTMRPLSILLLFMFFLLEGMALRAQDPSPTYEFRAAWIATVDNIDWPSVKGLDAPQQKTEFIRMLDLHQANGMNAVIMQIRPASDAFYPSPYEPWSEWLTGVQGTPPKPYYDPLAFMIEETHKRGMEFHAWCNPYRAQFNLAKSSIAPTHITRMRPDWFLDYGDKRYFDPGNPQVQDFVTAVVADIVRRYPVDAIHFDDYFYPYRISGKAFPDTAGYRLYGGNMTLDDWRRSNVDSIIVKLYRAIRKENPQCRFGISPFGVWRNQDKDPRGSATRAGQTNYDDLYADILLWLEKGWIDYVAPQLYWEFSHPNAPFQPLLNWWNRNTYGKACYIGLGYYKAGTNAVWRDRTLIPRQIAAIRQAAQVNGAIYFSSKSFQNNPLGWNDSLKNRYYRDPALVPPMPWIPGQKPPAPRIIGATVTDNPGFVYRVSPSAEFDEDIRLLAVYRKDWLADGSTTEKLVKVLPYSDTLEVRLAAPAGVRHTQFSFTYVSHANYESAAEKAPLRDTGIRGEALERHQGFPR
jgi:uncharacterized lipoprotein YddW (UPF0748 family)